MLDRPTYLLSHPQTPPSPVALLCYSSHMTNSISLTLHNHEIAQWSFLSERVGSGHETIHLCTYVRREVVCTPRGICTHKISTRTGIYKIKFYHPNMYPHGNLYPLKKFAPLPEICAAKFVPLEEICTPKYIPLLEICTPK